MLKFLKIQLLRASIEAQYTVVEFILMTFGTLFMIRGYLFIGLLILIIGSAYTVIIQAAHKRVKDRKMNFYFVYGTDTCPYCEKAKELIQSKAKGTVAYINIADRPDLRNPDWKTVPQIFHREKYIGGYEDLEKYLESLPA